MIEQLAVTQEKLTAAEAFVSVKEKMELAVKALEGARQDLLDPEVNGYYFTRKARDWMRGSIRLLNEVRGLLNDLTPEAGNAALLPRVAEPDSQAIPTPAEEAYRLVYEALQLTPGSSKQDVARIWNALALLPALKPLPEQNPNPSNSTPLDHIGEVAEKVAHRVNRVLEIITPFPETALSHEKRQYTVHFMREVRDLLIALSALSPQRDDSGLVEELVTTLECCAKACLCTRDTKGFEYGEQHRRLGKAKAGSRWATPAEMAAEALAKHAIQAKTAPGSNIRKEQP